MPVATTVNVAVWPSATVRLEGWVVNAGTSAVGVTVSVKFCTAAEPTPLLAVNCKL